ncbi:MAG TPA: hypothetical protein VGR37_11845 [Longimicrobiaceae bacterium]|nr:hypothetical protein [Longimicrobiaceae bacterium]
MTRLISAAVAAVVLAAAVFTPPIAAQEEDGTCGRCYDNYDGTAHVFGHSWFGSYWYMHCSAFNSCHSNSQYGNCTGNHFSCSLFGVMLVDAVGKLAERGERRAVEDLAARYPSLLGFDSYGRAIVTDCDGRPMVSWPIPISA